MKVAVSVHGRFHAFELARGLFERGALCQLATTYPGPVARRFLPASLPLRTAPALELWRRAAGRLAWLPAGDAAIARRFARFTARTLPPAGAAQVLVGWSSATLEAIEPARARGMTVVLERGSSHIAHQCAVLTETYLRFGLDAGPTPPEIIEREEAEYAAADYIAVPTRFAARTFTDRGIAADKLLINGYGVDLTGFAPRTAEPPSPRPRILFVGQVGLRKGVPDLLEAFAPLAASARLDLVGPWERGMEAVLGGLPTDGVTLPGPLARERLRAAYADAAVFCLPSVEEGFGMVLLQAMAVGLPVVTTTVSAGPDLIEHGVDGLLVPPSDPVALRDALADLLADPRRRAAMGRAARAKVEASFSWDHYVDRALAHYRTITA